MDVLGNGNLNVTTSIYIIDDFIDSIRKKRV